MNVGIIGAGFFGEKHAAAIHALDDLTLVAASRTDPGQLESFTDRFGGTGYTEYRDLLDDPRVDGVVVATPHASHREIAIAAAAAGKHVLLEKPMATTPSECDDVLEACERAGITLMVGHVTHFSRAFRIAKDLLGRGEMGRVVAGLSVMRKQWFEPNRRPWHLDRARGGGVLMTGGIHAVDRLTWLMGADVTSVSAQLGTRFFDQSADDTGLLFLRYANDAAGAVFSVGYEEGAPEHGTELTCSKGILRVHTVHGVSVGRGERWEVIPDSGMNPWIDEALIQEWRAFTQAVHGGSEPAVSGRFARHVMAALFAAETSSRERREVAVAPSCG